MFENTGSLYRYALLVAAFALIAIISGAVITSSEVVARQAQTAATPIGEGPHRILSIALIALSLGGAIWMSAMKSPAFARALAWAGFLTLVADAALGWSAAPLSPSLGTFHAFLAHLFFAIAVTIAVLTSANWNREPERVDDGGWSFLRPIALATPPVAFIQIGLGAAYRHQAMGILWHMAGAMVVALMALIVSAVVLQNFPGPAPLRHAATALITIVLAQVCLGIAAFLMLVLNVAGSMVFFVITVGHVTIGAATLAASIIMAMQVWRSLVPKIPVNGN